MTRSLQTLRPYQLEDVQKLLTLDSAGCFNEQRTGKTPTAITVMATRNLNKIVVVTPASALYQWKEEWELWTNTPAIVITGTPKRREKLLAEWTQGAIIISYGTLKETAKSHGMVTQILKHKPEGIIADEAHRFKEPSTAVARAMQKLSKIPYKLALTGTPAPNKPYEIWGILHWLYPDRYRGYWKFIQDNFYSYDRAGQYGNMYKEIGNWLPGKKFEFARELNKISTQRKRKEVMSWLPDKDYQDIKLPPTELQTKYLNELEQFFETEDVVTQGVLDRLIRVRQVCASPALLSLKGGSPKLDWLLQYTENYPDTPTIVFSKFTSFIHLIEEELKRKKVKYQVITGETPIVARNKAKLDFQAGKLNLLLINIDAGKEALTLDRGECCIFLDQFPPAADIAQAEDRFVSTTEDKADKPHKIIRLMMKGTYDEELYKLVESRASATDIINNYKKYLRGVN